MKRMHVALRILLCVVINIGLVAAIGLPIRAYIAPPSPDTPWFAWALAFTLQPLFIVQALLFTKWLDGRPLSSIPLRWSAGARRTTLWGVLLTIALIAGYVWLTQVSGVAAWGWNAGFVLVPGLLTALLGAMAGFGEEFLFRGYLMKTLESYGPRWSAVISSLAFAAMHMLVGRFSPLDQLALFLHGYMFAVLAQRTKSLWPGVVIHFVYNFLTSVVWSGDPYTAMLAFYGELGWTKWAFKALMVVPYLALAAYLHRGERSEGARQAA